MSAPKWWGDWRPILTPHTGNLQPTDLLECTSIVGGLPVNTAITGAQIIAAASGGAATWGSITGTLSAQTDLQGALDNKVPYTGATADVNLGSHDLTATQGTFATGGSSDTLTVNHTSGSGKAITITKGGSGEGIYVNKTSGSGNAVTIVGDLEATTIKKTSGTSTQFLKADGSVDTTTYQPTLVSGTNIKTVNGNSLLGSGDLTVGGSGLTVGTTAITSGTIGRVLFEGTGNVLQQDASFFWDNTNKRLGVGATPSTAVRLDVRAQGALSTDIAFRVRNSADTLNLFAVNGDSSWISRNNSNSNQYIYWNGTNRLELKNDASGEAFISNNTNGLGLSGATGLRLSTGNKGIYIYNSGNFYIGNATGIQAGSGQGNILFANNTGPTTNVVDHHYYYSADIVAGNAAPHFRTENGAIIKLYQQTTAVAASTFVQNSGATIHPTSTFDGYTLSQIVKALRNTGILA